ncbi:molybdate ABC transporter substrate-binding protein [Hansschlegelia zhihuaiae]|uniref:Molybdate ABC transporter substrate-binding protein n=1 Tax=Hansschlegelia zhihuaiae TaxID=405005 RepID=A0A4Q0M651_9HYPH|nr:molybdate ABC transporter substrate-binding protein [Hansschlegelia zhihuaiae]RXF68510.1 molybdate ABC transporter substrate-binding protein [Hansschlegelia zhihuaiae]
MSITRRLFGGFALAAALVVAPLAASAQDSAKQPVVAFAAASLKNALDAIAKDWTKETGIEVKASYAASSALAKQIEQAAPADLFISADVPWMDYVAEKSLIAPSSRVDLLGNKLVLVAGQSWSKGDVELKKGVDLAGLLGNERLAMGEPGSVPAGKYGKAALEKLGVWDKVSSKVAGAENVRAALALVSRGEAPLGIVYKTDAAADKGVKIVGTFPADSHPPIVYPAAKLKDARSPNADAFLKRLSSASAKKTFEEVGFTVIAPPSGS